MEKYIMAIDEGTTSTRAILFNHAGKSYLSHKKNLHSILHRRDG